MIVCFLTLGSERWVPCVSVIIMCIYRLLCFLNKFGNGAIGVDGVEHELIYDFSQLCPVGEAGEFSGVFMNGFEHVIEGNGGVDFGV